MHGFTSRFRIYDTIIHRSVVVPLHGQRPSFSLLPTVTSASMVPTLVVWVKSRTAAVNQSSVCADRSRAVVLLGLVLAHLIPVPNPLQLFHTGLLPLLDFLSLDTFSFFHAEHSLKLCSLFCLPLIHNRHSSESVHPNFSLNCAVRRVWALRSW